MKRLLQSSLDKINSDILKIRTVSSNNNTDQKELFERKNNLQNEINFIDIDLADKHPDLIDYVNTKRLKLDTIQKEISKNEVIIKFIEINDSVYVAVLDNVNFKLELITTEKQILKEISKKYRSLLEILFLLLIHLQSEMIFTIIYSNVQADKWQK